VAISNHLPESGHAWQRFSPNVTLLGLVSALTAMSSAMIYGLLPVFVVQVIGASIAVLGLMEGLAEAATSLVKIVSGAASDWIGRRKPLVVLGYALSALVKTLFPTAGALSTVLLARVIDRLGKGIRDAPRDAFVADLISPSIRGSGFGWRLALAIGGFAVGPLVAIAVMRASRDDFRLVFWIALIPAYLSVLVLLVSVQEIRLREAAFRTRIPIVRADIAGLPTRFWWIIAVASLFALARFSQAFLVLKLYEVRVDVAFLPAILIVTHVVFSATAYPFGILADHIDRRLQLAIGAVILVCADAVLASSGTVALVALGAALWGLQLGATQGLLAAAIADAAPEHLRGSAFGIYDVAAGLATFAASAGAGVLWGIGGSTATFAAGAGIAAVAAIILLFRRSPPAPLGNR
jgi:MFS family permease